MDLEKRYCCPKKDAKNFENCRWYGKPGSCFDNHCPIGHSVQLTDSPYGLGESCFPRLERSRVFCCDPAHGKSPFLPVPLNRLFKDPPTSDNVDTDFTLKLDDTFGSGKAKTGEDPSDAAFQFVVLASPEELQTSLDKRDGSHWELYGCQYTTSEEEQTIQMFCTDTSENSNCHKIGLGHGVPGTILEMPAGCGPGRYAVAKSMEPSKNQTIPPALRKRGLINPVVYDLTFDYDFKRVPRDVGDTQMRIDFSNKNDYWDNVVAAAASKRKAKRSISDVGGNHKRWLEEEWRDDYHFGGLSQEELHKRWFGSDLVAWLTNLVSPKIKKEFTHDIDEEILAKIIDDQVNCGSGNAKFHAHILVQAMTNIKVSTSFGFSLITRLNFDSPDSPLDLSQSYLTFSNNGEITATFRLEALMKVSYDTGDRTIVTLPFPGATFRVPGIVTIGPSVRVVGSFNAGLTLSAEVETKVDIASWDVAQTLPDANNDFDPKLDEPMDTKDSGNPNGLMQPQFYAAVQAEGKVEAHLKAIAEFGIRFDDKWKIGAATAGVAADGFVRFSVAVGNSTDKSCPWTYGLKLGAALIAEVDTPSMFGWGKRTWDLPGSGEVDIIKGGTCPDLRAGSPDKRGVSIISSGSQYEHYGISSTDMVSSNFSRRALSKRATPWGPPFHLPLQAMFCPNANSGSSNEGTECEKLSGWSKRSVSLETRDAGDLSTLHRFEKRARKDPITFCKGGGRMTIRAPPYDGADSSYYTVGLPEHCSYFRANRSRMFQTHLYSATPTVPFVRTLGSANSNMNLLSYSTPSMCWNFN
jgi:chitinase